jgi:hypothetical protein
MDEKKVITKASEIEENPEMFEELSNGRGSEEEEAEAEAEAKKE